MDKVPLQSLWKQYLPEMSLNYTELSRVMAGSFPEILQSLFDRPDDSSRKYNVCTQYPELFLIVLATFNKSPLASNIKTANSLVSNKEFYDSCINVIAPDNNWSGTDKIGKPLVEYYLFERLYRLNTKFRLFQADYNEGKPASILSPSLLADFFYSSPLVFFPENMLTNLFYVEAERDEEEKKQLKKKTVKEIQFDCNKAAQFLHFLIQLSSVWFPVILFFLRTYTRKFNIVTYKSVYNFLLPCPTDFNTFQEKFAPQQLNLSSEHIKQDRSFRDYYSKRWGQFFPTGGYHIETLDTPGLHRWRERQFPDNYTDLDCNVLRKIQDTL